MSDISTPEQKPTPHLVNADLECCGTCKKRGMAVANRMPVMVCTRRKVQPVPIEPWRVCTGCEPDDGYERDEGARELAK